VEIKDNVYARKIYCTEEPCVLTEAGIKIAQSSVRGTGKHTRNRWILEAGLVGLIWLIPDAYPKLFEQNIIRRLTKKEEALYRLAGKV